jgi:hypothetical protein
VPGSSNWRSRVTNVPPGYYKWVMILNFLTENVEKSHPDSGVKELRTQRMFANGRQTGRIDIPRLEQSQDYHRDGWPSG